MTILFTDLDGSLLDTQNYSWEAARPALELLRARGVPWVMVSSKTRAEVEELREELGNRHPFVVENGAAAYIPRGYFGFPVENAVSRGKYEVLEWGRPYSELVEALRRESEAAGCPVKGFHAMTVDEVREATGLPVEAAVRAMQREYDEPFLAEGGDAVLRLLAGIEEAGLRWTHGGRFYHICGNNDKATAVATLAPLYRWRFGPVTSIGLGDGLNDLPMLRAVDTPVLLRPDRPAGLEFQGLRYSRSPGPRGWNESVLELLG